MALGTQLPSLDGLKYVKNALVSPPAGVKAVHVIELWATWCPPCRDSIPHLTELQREYKDRHVYIVGVTNENDVPKVQAFVSDQGAAMDYTVAVDESGRFTSELMTRAGASGIPYAFVVDATRTITYCGHPMDPKFEAALNAAAAAAGPRVTVTERTLLPVTDSLEMLMARPVKELKQLLAERNIDAKDCFEKGDLARRVIERCAGVTYYATS